MTNILSFDSIDICQSVQIVAYLGSWITKRKTNNEWKLANKGFILFHSKDSKESKEYQSSKKMDDKNKDNK